MSPVFSCSLFLLSLLSLLSSPLPSHPLFLNSLLPSPSLSSQRRRCVPLGSERAKVRGERVRAACKCLVRLRRGIEREREREREREQGRAERRRPLFSSGVCVVAWRAGLQLVRTPWRAERLCICVRSLHAFGPVCAYKCSVNECECVCVCVFLERMYVNAC